MIETLQRCQVKKLKEGIRPLLTLLTFLTFLTLARSQSNTIAIPLASFEQTGLANQPVRIQLTSPAPRILGGVGVLPDQRIHFTDTQNTAWYSNLVAGAYLLIVPGEPGLRLPFNVYTNTTGTNNVFALAGPLSQPPNPYSNYVSQANLQAALANLPTGGGTNGGTPIGAGAHISLATNAGVVTVSVVTNFADLAGSALGLIESQGVVTNNGQLVTLTLGDPSGNVLLDLNGGNLGINQDAPQYVLDITGTIGTSQFGNNNSLTLDDGTGAVFWNAASALNVSAGTGINLNAGGAMNLDSPDTHLQNVHIQSPITSLWYALAVGGAAGREYLSLNAGAEIDALTINSSGQLANLNPAITMTNLLNGNITQASLRGLATVTVNPLGIINGGSAIPNGGSQFGPDTAGTTTGGLQEAVNAINAINGTNTSLPAGGKIEVAPGVIFTSATVNFYGTNITYVITGAGITASGIVYVGGGGSPALLFQNKSQAWDTPAVFVSDLFVAAAVDTKAFCVEINGFSRAELRNDWFGYWPSMTNGYPGGLTPPTTGGGGSAHYLTGVYIEGNSIDDIGVVSGCSFNGLACGLLNDADHSIVCNNMFSFCGNNAALPQVALPATFSSAYVLNSVWNMTALGVCIIQGHSAHLNCEYLDNYFYGGNYAYGMDDGAIKNAVISENDAFESMQGNLIVSPQSHFTQINPHYFVNAMTNNLAINNVYPNGTNTYALQTTNLNLNILQDFLSISNATMVGYASLSLGNASLITSNVIATAVNAGTLTTSGGITANGASTLAGQNVINGTLTINGGSGTVSTDGLGNLVAKTLTANASGFNIIGNGGQITNLNLASLGTTGSLAGLTLPVSISGNAATATQAANLTGNITATQITGQIASTNLGVLNLTNLPAAAVTNNGSGYTLGATVTGSLVGNAATATGPPAFLGVSSSAVPVVLSASTSGQFLSGNVTVSNSTSLYVPGNLVAGTNYGNGSGLTNLPSSLWLFSGQGYGFSGWSQALTAFTNTIGAATGTNVQLVFSSAGKYQIFFDCVLEQSNLTFNLLVGAGATNEIYFYRTNNTPGYLGYTNMDMLIVGTAGTTFHRPSQLMTFSYSASAGDILQPRVCWTNANTTIGGTYLAEPLFWAVPLP